MTNKLGDQAAFPSDQVQDTDKVIFRWPDDYYADRVTVTKSGLVGIDVGGKVFVKSIASWHKLALAALAQSEKGEK